VPSSRSPRTRARDLDRTEVCSALDAAYADGQLDGEEHRSRTAAAMAAKTLGELRALVDDLQLDQPMPELRERYPVPAAGRRGSRIGAAVVALVLVGAGFGIAKIVDGFSPSGTPGSVQGAGVGVDPVVVGAVALQTPDGLRSFVESVRTEFGTTQVAEATVYPDYAVVYTPVPGAPARAQSSYFKGGFEAPSSAGGRDPDHPLVDLSAFDVDAILALVAGAGESLHVPNPTSCYMIIRDDGDGPSVSIHASNSDTGESGYLEAKPDGRIITVRPYEPD
jgi:hypothetical protein